MRRPCYAGGPTLIPEDPRNITTRPRRRTSKLALHTGLIALYSLMLASRSFLQCNENHHAFTSHVRLGGALCHRWAHAGPRSAIRRGHVALSRPRTPRPERVSLGLRTARARSTGSSASTIASARRSIQRRTRCAGSETIHYVNHSPDSLPYLWLFVEQNICEPNSITNSLNQPPLVFLGIELRLLLPGLQQRAEAGVADDRAGARRSARASARRCASTSTTPLAPGASLDLDAVWHFNVPAAGRRADGPRRSAVRDRAVVSAHGGLRRREGLEPRAVHRRRRVLSRVRRLRRHADGAVRATSSRRRASWRIRSRC